MPSLLQWVHIWYVEKNMTNIKSDSVLQECDQYDTMYITIRCIYDTRYDVYHKNKEAISYTSVHL